MQINIIDLINRINALVEGNQVALYFHSDNTLVFEVENVRYYAFHKELMKCIRLNTVPPNFKDKDPKYISNEEVTEVLAKHVCNNLFMSTGKKAFPEIKD